MHRRAQLWKFGLVLGFTLIFIGLINGDGLRALAQELRETHSDARAGGVLRLPLLNNPPTLDPAYVQDIYSVEVVQQLFDGLVKFSPQLFVVPALAASWQVENGGKTYRFFLRKNARFHDGRPVTAEDVVFSLSRLLFVDPPPTILRYLLKIKGAAAYRKHEAKKVAGLQVVDDHTLVIQLDEPYVPFLVALGMYRAKIVPKAEVTKDEKGFGQHPVGSGPFKFGIWQKNKLLHLERFQDYYAGPAFLDGIDYVIYPGIQIERILADFKQGKLDQMPVYTQVRDQLAMEQGLQWIHRPSLSLQFYGINCEAPQLNNRNLRLALNLAIDRNKLVQQAYNGQFEPARSVLPPGMLGYQPNAAGGFFDLSAAKAHLQKAQAELQEPLHAVEIVSNSTSPFAMAELEFVGKSWARLGIELKTKFIRDWSEFEHYISSDSVQLYRYVWFADMPDPDDFLRPLFAADSEFNYMHYRDERVDHLLRSAEGISDPMQRAEIYHSAERAILKSCPLIPLIHLSIDSVYKPRVHGIQVSALGTHNMSLHSIWLKPVAPHHTRVLQK